MPSYGRDRPWLDRSSAAGRFLLAGGASVLVIALGFGLAGLALPLEVVAVAAAAIAVGGAAA